MFKGLQVVQVWPLTVECFVANVIRDALRVQVERAKPPSKRIIRRWFCFTERICQQHCEDVQAREECDASCARLEPRMRIVLPKEALDVFLHIFEDKTTVAGHLETLGIIRDSGGNCVEIWCTDSCLGDPMMQTILNEAQRCRDTYESGHIRVTMTYSRPILVKFKETLTLEHVRRIVQKQFSIKLHNQLLTHKGQILSRGVLSDQDVGAGSVIIVCDRTLASW